MPGNAEVFNRFVGLPSRKGGGNEAMNAGFSRRIQRPMDASLLRPVTPLTRHLVVVSCVVHHERDGRIYGYGPFLRELEMFADLFTQVTLVAPRSDAPPPGDCIPIVHTNIAFAPLPATGGPALADKLLQVARLPELLWRIGREFAAGDVLHVRCPANTGLLGVALAPLFRKPRFAKYAGQWNGYPDEPLSVRLQRAILGSTYWGAPVTVYGHWPNQPAHVHGFFTSMMSDADVERAYSVSLTKQFETPLKVLFAGKLEAVKRVEAFIEALGLCKARGITVEAAVVGTGSLEERLKAQAEQVGVAVQFVGGLSWQDTQAWYGWAHVLVLPSETSEGWPKVVAEAMAHGCACVAVDHGQVGQMLAGRGYLLDNGSPEKIAEAIMRAAEHPAEARALGQSAALWAKGYSLDGLARSVRKLLLETWPEMETAPNPAAKALSM